MKIDVRPVQSKRDVLKFIKFPWKVYKGNDYWVPPLISERKSFFNPRKNPFFNHAEVQLFMAYRGSAPVGTISAHTIPDHNRIHKDRVGFFGFFETIDDQSVATALLDTAATWLSARGMETMRGPMNFSIHHSCGLLIDGFQYSPTVLMPYNPKYYVKFIESYGCVKASDLYALTMDMQEQVPPHIDRIAQRAWARCPDLTIRSIDMSKYDQEVNLIKEQYDQAMTGNWGYLPLHEDEFRYTVNSMKALVNPDQVIFLELDGKVIGYSLALPDYNIIFKKLNGRLLPFGILRLLFQKKRLNYGRIIALGVLSDFRDKRVAIVYQATWKAAVKAGVVGCEGGWTHENNPFLTTMKWFGGTIHKTYRIYDYALTRV
jgi:hypothetical protein